MYRKLRENFEEKDHLLAAILILIGVALVCYSSLILFFNLPSFTLDDWYSYYFLLLSLNYAILGASALVSGFLILKPRKTPGGRRKLGIISITIGILIILITIMYGIILVRAMDPFNISWIELLIGSLPQHALFVIPGIFLLIHGNFLIKYGGVSEEVGK